MLRRALSARLQDTRQTKIAASRLSASKRGASGEWLSLSTLYSITRQLTCLWKTAVASRGSREGSQCVPRVTWNPAGPFVMRPLSGTFSHDKMYLWCIAMLATDAVSRLCCITRHAGAKTVWERTQIDTVHKVCYLFLSFFFKAGNI